MTMVEPVPRRATVDALRRSAVAVTEVLLLAPSA
jgi:hypothetical protein